MSAKIRTVRAAIIVDLDSLPVVADGDTVSVVIGDVTLRVCMECGGAAPPDDACPFCGVKAGDNGPA